MDTLCVLHNTSTCVKRRTIARARADSKVRVAYAYDWSSQSDNIVLICETVNGIFRELEKRFSLLTFTFYSLGGKEGSIYCDICRQIRSADIVLFDISGYNHNVILELGLAIGAGTFAFVLRSKHYKRRRNVLSDLDGILEYRFSRRMGKLKFQTDFARRLKSKLIKVANRRTEESQLMIGSKSGLKAKVNNV